METIAPEMYPAFGEARKATTAATSAGEAGRPRGDELFASAMASAVVIRSCRAKALTPSASRSVFVFAGFRALTRTPIGPYASARPAVASISAALADPPARCVVIGTFPPIPTTLTTEPARRCAMSLTRGSKTLIYVRNLASIAARQSSGCNSSKGFRRAPPAALTRTSIGPRSSSASAITPNAAAGWDRSAAYPLIRFMWTSSVLHASPIRLLSRPTMLTTQPSARNCSAHANPIPRDPPVTRTCLPSSCRSNASSRNGCGLAFDNGVGKLLCDHDRWNVGVAARNCRHDGRVGNAQIGDA
ncbi:hypothetical protein NOV72_02075 [Caballeronia novacaledonica]|uniref:Uncharacterized protein n=1 Tax=Caballeronia novacaledonica TaxID=1544861 RepID=A0A2U3I402_9BURK|nr:hypothetical protein NOV72_02075 [Caballeronia novacaledonica]